MSYIWYNANPQGRNVGDCVIRALSKALNQSWGATYIALALQGFMMGDMPSANAVWGAYLRHKGFSRYLISDDCPDDYTVADFAADNPNGVYILALSGHVVCVINGDIYDTWNSGNEIPIYYWTKKGK